MKCTAEFTDKYMNHPTFKALDSAGLVSECVPVDVRVRGENVFMLVQGVGKTKNFGDYKNGINHGSICMSIENGKPKSELIYELSLKIGTVSDTLPGQSPDSEENLTTHD